MMARSPIDPEVPLRAAIESLLAPEVIGPLDELTDALFLASSLLSRLRLRIDAQDPRSGEVSSLDESFARSIALTRTLRERCLAPRARGEYASLTHTAREVVGRLQGALPDGVSLSVRCPTSAAIVAADRSDLRRAIVALVESGLDALASRGTLDLDVSQGVGAVGEHGRRMVLLELRSSAVIDERDARLQASVRPFVRALGGTVILREPLRGGTVIAVRLPGAC
jgi:signal transduction histidine kinase